MGCFESENLITLRKFDNWTDNAAFVFSMIKHKMVQCKMMNIMNATRKILFPFWASLLHNIIKCIAPRKITPAANYQFYSSIYLWHLFFCWKLWIGLLYISQLSTLDLPYACIDLVAVIRCCVQYTELSQYFLIWEVRRN